MSKVQWQEQNPHLRMTLSPAESGPYDDRACYSGMLQDQAGKWVGYWEQTLYSRGRETFRAVLY